MHMNSNFYNEGGHITVSKGTVNSTTPYPVTGRRMAIWVAVQMGL